MEDSLNATIQTNNMLSSIEAERAKKVDEMSLLLKRRSLFANSNNQQPNPSAPGVSLAKPPAFNPAYSSIQRSEAISSPASNNPNSKISSSSQGVYANKSLQQQAAMLNPNPKPSPVNPSWSGK